MSNHNIPVMEINDGVIKWWLNGRLHREDGPAVEYPDGGKEWHFHGLFHRNDGPAIEHSDGRTEWWLNGQYYTEEAWNNKMDELEIKKTDYTTKITDFTPTEVLNFLYEYSQVRPVKTGSRLHGYISHKLETQEYTDITFLFQNIDYNKLPISVNTAFLFFVRHFEHLLEPEYTDFKNRLHSWLVTQVGDEQAKARIESACRII